MTASGMNLYDSNMRASPQKILSFSLFGESTHLPDVMHCETIAARSVLHDWEFAPHRHARLHQVMLVESGGGTAWLEGARLALRPMSLLNLPPGCVHGFSFARGTQGYVATIADQLADDLLEGVGDVRRTLRQPHLVPATATIRTVIRSVWREFSGRSAARALVLRGLAATLLGLTARSLALSAAPDAETDPSPLMRRFEALLEMHYLDHWKVADYARALGITPTHLTRLARTATGDGVSRLIDERVMREARRNLAYTSMSVASIAYSLGFSDPAYFSRAFTRTVGVAPRVFRDRLN